MSAPAAATTRFFRFPRLVVRTRTTRNQMVTFSVISVAAFSMMMLAPAPRAAFAAVDPEATAPSMEVTVKADRLPVRLPTEADEACAGQAWGSEDLDCILAIARDSGIHRTVRLADAGLRY